MSLGHQAPEQRVGVAFARVLVIIAIVTLLGWFFARNEPPRTTSALSAATDAGAY